MSYGNRFQDEPRQGETFTETEELQKFTPPTEPGFYLVRVPERHRPTRDGKPTTASRGKWNSVAYVYGVAPFFKMKIWDVPNHSTHFGNAPHLIEYGPMIGSQEDFESLD